MARGSASEFSRKTAARRASQNEPVLIILEKAVKTFGELAEQAFAERSQGELLWKLERREAAVEELLREAEEEKGL